MAGSSIAYSVYKHTSLAAHCSWPMIVTSDLEVCSMPGLAAASFKRSQIGFAATVAFFLTLVVLASNVSPGSTSIWPLLFSSCLSAYENVQKAQKIRNI